MNLPSTRAWPSSWELASVNSAKADRPSRPDMLWRRLPARFSTPQWFSSTVESSGQIVEESKQASIMYILAKRCISLQRILTMMNVAFRFWREVSLGLLAKNALGRAHGSTRQKGAKQPHIACKGRRCFKWLTFWISLIRLLCKSRTSNFSRVLRFSMRWIWFLPSMRTWGTLGLESQKGERDKTWFMWWIWVFVAFCRHSLATQTSRCLLFLLPGHSEIFAAFLKHKECCYSSLGNCDAAYQSRAKHRFVAHPLGTLEHPTHLRKKTSPFISFGFLASALDILTVPHHVQFQGSKFSMFWILLSYKSKKAKWGSPSKCSIPRHINELEKPEGG